MNNFRIGEKVFSIGFFLDKKYTRQNAVLTEEMLDETGDKIRTFVLQIPFRISSTDTAAYTVTTNLHTCHTE
jgi:hypothetical protein